MDEDVEIFKSDKNKFKYTGDLKKYNILPNINKKIGYKKREEKVNEFYDGEKDDLNLSTNLNSKNSNLNKTNENPNQNNQILNNNNNENNNSNNTENKENPVELKCDKKNNSFISEENKIEPNPNTIQNNQNSDSKNNNKKKSTKRIKKNSRRRNDDDEIRARIKNKFHKFSINYSNYLIRKENNNKQKFKLRKIEYKKYSGGNKKQNKEFLQKKFKDFIKENKITPKFKNVKPELNKEHLKNYDLNNNLCNNNLNESNVSNFLNMDMGSIFNNYFLNKKNEKDFLNQKRKKRDKIIFFDDFIEELRDKKEDDNYIENVKKVAKNYVSFYNNVKEKDESISSKKRNLFYTYQCK